MKTKLVAVIALIFCAFMAEASKVEGNGNIITKEISVDNYSEIELGGNIEYSGNNFWGNRSNKKFPVFKYTHGRSASLKITIDENLFPLLSIKSNNGRLAIRIQDGTRIKPTQYVIEGSSKTLKYLKTSGPMDFEAQNAFSEDQLEIKISGSSDLKETEEFLQWCEKFSEANGVNITITISDDIANATESMKKYF